MSASATKSTLIFFFGTEFFIVAVPRWAESGAFYRSRAEMCLASLGVTCPIYFWWTSARLVQQCALHPWHFWSRALAELNQPDVLRGRNRMSHCIECCCRRHRLVLGSKVVLCEFCQKTNMQWEEDCSYKINDNGTELRLPTRTSEGCFLSECRTLSRPGTGL